MKENVKINVLKINNKDIQIKEWMGERVLSIYDILYLHKHDADTMSKIINLFQSKNNLMKGKDYFIVSNRKTNYEFVGWLTSLMNFIDDEIPVFTEVGYLIFTENLSSELDWKIKRELVNRYFEKDSNDEEKNIVLDNIKSLISDIKKNLPCLCVQINNVENLLEENNQMIHELIDSQKSQSTKNDVIQVKRVKIFN